MSASQQNDPVVRNRAGRMGFTLIELMVVIAIIALLIAIIMPTMGAVRTHMRRSASMAMLNTIAVAIDAYKSEHNTIPESRLPAGTTYDINNGNGNWYGAQLLAEALTGYLGQGLSKTTTPPPDGAEGPGFRLVSRGKVYGPYVPLDKMRMENYPTPAPAPKDYAQRPVFLDNFDNPVLYYRYDANYPVPGSPKGGYNWNDNVTTGPKTPAMQDINDYAAKVTGPKLEFYRMDYLLVTPGPDLKWRPNLLSQDTGTDDCVNFAPEGGS